MEVLVFAQVKNNIHLKKTETKQKLSFLSILRHTLSIRTFLIRTDTLKHERTITYKQCLNAANQTLEKPSVNIDSVHDPVSRSPNGSRLSRRLLQHLWKTQNHLFFWIEWHRKQTSG